MIRSVGFDPICLILEIEFCSRKIYQYESVPERVFRELMSADSKGRYFEQAINRTFSYRQV